MESSIYAVSPTPHGWVVFNAGEFTQPYETVDAALEAAYAEMSARLESGLDATVTVNKVGPPGYDFSRHVGKSDILYGGVPIVWAA